MRSNQNACWLALHSHSTKALKERVPSRWLGVVANAKAGSLGEPRNDASARFGLNPEGTGSMGRMAVLRVACLDDQTALPTPNQRLGARLLSA